MIAAGANLFRWWRRGSGLLGGLLGLPLGCKPGLKMLVNDRRQECMLLSKVVQ